MKALVAILARALLACALFASGLAEMSAHALPYEPGCLESFSRVASKRPRQTDVLRRAIDNPVALYEELLRRANAHNVGAPAIRNNFSVIDIFRDDMLILQKEIREFQNYLSVRGITEYDGLLQKLAAQGEELMEKGLPYAEYGGFTGAFSQMQDLFLAIRTNAKVPNEQAGIARIYQVAPDGTPAQIADIDRRAAGVPLLSEDAAAAALASYLRESREARRAYESPRYANGMPIFALPSVSGVNPYDYSVILGANLHHIALSRKPSFGDNRLFAPSRDYSHDRAHLTIRADESKPLLDPADRAAAVKAMAEEVELRRRLVAEIRAAEDPLERAVMVSRLFYGVHEINGKSASVMLNTNETMKFAEAEAERLMSLHDREIFHALPPAEKAALLRLAEERLGLRTKFELSSRRFLREFEEVRLRERDRAHQSRDYSRTQAIAKAYLADIYGQVDSLSQAELARLFDKSVVRIFRERGQLPGAGRGQSRRGINLEALLEEFAEGNPESAFSGAYVNFQQAPTLQFEALAYDGTSALRPDELRVFADRALELAVWEKVQRLVARGEWNEIKDPQVRDAYMRAIAYPGFREQNSLRYAGSSQRLFPPAAD